METKIIYPLYLLPPAGYIKKLITEPRPLISIGEKFEKQTLRSRFEIAGPNNIQLLSVPVHHPFNTLQTAQITLDYSQNWNIKHWRSIETAYRKAPFFEFYAHHFEPLFFKKYNLLAELCIEMLHVIFKILKSDIKIILQTEFTNSISINLAINPEPYFQVFAVRHGFLPNLSILDLIFNEGPLSADYLELK